MSAQEKDRPASPGQDEDALTEQLLAKGQVGLDATLPPTPLKQLLAADGASIYVFSTDESLVEVVQQAGGEQFPIEGLEDWAALTGLVEQGHCRIVLLDAETVGTQLTRRVGELKSLAAPLVILVAAPRDAAQKLIGLLSDRSIHRLLIKPAAPGITRLLLESAVSRYLQLREQAEQTAGLAFEVPARPQEAPSATKWPAWLLATALVSLLVGGAIVTGLSHITSLPGVGTLLHRQATSVSSQPVAGTTAPTGGATAGSAAPAAGPNGAAATAAAGQAASPATSAHGGASNQVGPPEAGNSAPSAAGGSEAGSAPAPGSTPAAGGTSAPAGATRETQAKEVPAHPYRAQLDKAAAALAQGHVAEPAGDNALDDYAAILTKAPDQPEASRQMQHVLGILYGRAEDGMLAGKLDAAGAALDAIRRVRPDSKRLEFLETQLKRARQDAARQTAQAKKARAAANAAKTEASAANASTEAAAAGNAGSQPGAAAELTNLLDLGRMRLQQQQLLAPAGDSANDYLQRATGLSPNDPRVLKLREDLAAAVAAQARIVLGQGDLKHADTLIREAFTLGANQETLAGLDVDLDAARQAVVEKQRDELLANGTARLESGKLIAPAKDNALFYLASLKAQAPDYPGLDAAWSKLVDDLNANANEAIAGGEWSAAQKWMAGLARANAGSADLAKLRERLVGRRQEQFLKNPMPISGLKVVQEGTLRYPLDARQSNKEGYVDVQFIVGTDGMPRDAEVVDAKPKGWFEKAALASVAQYRFAPFELDGHVYQRLVRARVRFTLK